MNKTVRNITRTLCTMVIFTSFAACDQTSIEGKWVEPVPGIEGQVQGISLENDGTAASINMATLEYDTWTKQGDKLILCGKSIGNRKTIPITDTLSIEKLTADKLILKKVGMTITYTRL